MFPSAFIHEPVPVPVFYTSLFDDLDDLVFLRVLPQLFQIGSIVGRVWSERFEMGDAEDRVDSVRMGESDSISDWANPFRYFKWAIVSPGELGAWSFQFRQL